MARHNRDPSEHTIADMVREELRRLGYGGRRSVPRRIFHSALGSVCHRLLGRTAASAKNSRHGMPAMEYDPAP